MDCVLQGLYEFRFQLVYTSLEEQLAKIKELWDLALRRKGREGDANSSAKQRLNAIIQACPELACQPGLLLSHQEPTHMHARIEAAADQDEEAVGPCAQTCRADLANLPRQAHEGSEGFNPGWLEDENERVVVELPGSCVSPLCSQPGRVALTSTRIYFQPFNISSNSPVEVYQLNKAGHPPLHPHHPRLPDPKVQAAYTACRCCLCWMR